MQWPLSNGTLTPSIHHRTFSEHERINFTNKQSIWNTIDIKYPLNIWKKRTTMKIIIYWNKKLKQKHLSWFMIHITKMKIHEKEAEIFLNNEQKIIQKSFTFWRFWWKLNRPLNKIDFLYSNLKGKSLFKSTSEFLMIAFFLHLLLQILLTCSVAIDLIDNTIISTQKTMNLWL